MQNSPYSCFNTIYCFIYDRRQLDILTGWVCGHGCWKLKACCFYRCAYWG